MQELFYTGLTNALVASVLALLVFALTRVVRAPALSRALWILVLAKLVTPPLLEVPISVSEVTREHSTSQFNSLSVPSGAPDTPAFHQDAFLVFEPDPANSEEFGTDHAEPVEVAIASLPSDWNVVASCAWAVGSLLLLFYLLFITFRFRSLLRSVRGAPHDVNRLVAELAARLGLHRAPQALVVSAPISPFVWSFGLRPKLILPESLLSGLEKNRLSLVLAHELSHIRRGDHLVRWFETVPLLLYWWLPVVWLARRELRAAEEQCSDASVLELFPDSDRSYVETLVFTVDLQSGRRSPGFALPFNESSLTRRCRMILREKKVRSRLGLCGSLFLSCATVLLLPLSADLFGQTADKAPAPVPEPAQFPIDSPSVQELAPAENPSAKKSQNLEKRVRRLEKLVERLVTALESKSAYGRSPRETQPLRRFGQQQGKGFQRGNSYYEEEASTPERRVSRTLKHQLEDRLRRWRGQNESTSRRFTLEGEVLRNARREPERFPLDEGFEDPARKRDSTKKDRLQEQVSSMAEVAKSYEEAIKRFPQNPRVRAQWLRHNLRSLDKKIEKLKKDRGKLLKDLRALDENSLEGSSKPEQ